MAVWVVTGSMNTVPYTLRCPAPDTPLPCVAVSSGPVRCDPSCVRNERAGSGALWGGKKLARTVWPAGTFHDRSKIEPRRIEPTLEYSK